MVKMFSKMFYQHWERFENFQVGAANEDKNIYREIHEKSFSYF